MKPLEPSHILSRIVDAKRERLHRAKLRIPDAIIKRMADTAPPVSVFSEALKNERRVRIIAEVKKASPSKGVFREDFDVEGLASTYSAAGASAISVVTEEDFFQGDLGWISRIRKTSTLPVLRKDFVFDAFQVYETRAAGAAAILLIVAMLQPEEIRGLLQLAAEMKLEALVEVHDENELQQALDAGARIVGVNNRNLKTFAVDIETSLRLAEQIPDGCLFVVESGIRGRAAIESLLAAGADAFLIGEHFLISQDPGAAVRELL